MAQQHGDPAALAHEIQSLDALDTNDLKQLWRDLYGTAPPKRISRGLLTRAIAYRIQEQALGGLKPATRRRLRMIAATLESGGDAALSRVCRPPIKPGTRPLREWQGLTHEVIVLEAGVHYRGETWASLSAVAREITGTRWSGPLFFGLKGRRSDSR